MKPLSSSERIGDRPYLSIKNLSVAFFRGKTRIQAVSGVDLSVDKGTTLALIGESGSGKSVTLRSILRLHPKSAKISGAIHVAGKDVLSLGGAELTDFRGKTVSMVFQEPLLALDPVYSIGEQIVEAIRCHAPGVDRASARQRALELFERVRIPSPERRLDAWPHELSGGMRQRAMIALALSSAPSVLLADEPTTALDATVQIQILLLLRQLQRELGLTTVFVTHDMGAAAEVADRFAVMYAGRIVEEGSAEEVVKNPGHPYTRALLATRAAGAMVKGRRLESIPGSPPDLADMPPGCAFAPRCPFAAERCFKELPQLEALPGSSGRKVRCHRTGELQPLFDSRGKHLENRS